MPTEDIPKFETAEHDEHDDHTGLEGGGAESDAAEQAKGALRSSDGKDATSGQSIAGTLAAGAGASSADGVTEDGGAGVPAHEPAPPHTGSGPFPDPPQP
jgi:hypothetical protein